MIKNYNTENLTEKVETYEIKKRWLFQGARARREYDKLKNVETLEVTSLTNPWIPWKCEYKIVYKKNS